MQRTFISAVILIAVFGAAFLLATAPRQRDDVKPEATRSGAMEALEFWTRSRAYPAADIPAGTYAAAYRAQRAMLKRKPRVLAGLPGWRPIGPDNLSGRMISIVVNPLAPSTVYAGSASGGLWRTRTGGLGGDWTRIETGHPVLGVGAIAISPADTNIMYIGTGEVYRYQATAGGLVVRTTRGSYGMGILKTTDGGATWTKSLDWSYDQQRGVQRIKLNPLNPATVWAATSEGIYKSTDAGASWTELIQLFMGVDIVIHPTDTNTVLVSAGNLGIGGGIYRTTDGGAGWAQVNPVGFTGKALLDAPPGFPGVVYASIADSTTGVGSLWRSTNFGVSWSSLTANNIFGVQGWYSHYVAAHPTNPSLLFHAAVSAARSTNGGSSFSGISGLYSDNHDFAYDPGNPNVLYSANDDGIYRSTNFGASFTPVNGGLATGQLYNGFSSSQTDSLLALVQSQDHIPGYLYVGAGTWPESAVDEAGWTAINPVRDSLMYAVSRYGQGVYRSTDRGATFSFRASLPSNGAWNTPIVIAPSSPSTIYVAKTKFFRSVEPASGTWTALNGGADLDGNPALSLAVSATSPDTVYVGTGPYVDRAHLFRSTNGGNSWTDITGPLPDRYPLDLAVDPRNSRTVYAALGGYGTGHVWRSTNSGTTWSDVSGALPDIPATALLVDPTLPATVYLGTDIGVYISTDAGTSWNAFNDGLPDAVLVSDLSLTNSNRTLRVGTHGNGAFERSLPASLPALYALSPSGGEHWEVGSQRMIAWDNIGVPAARVEFSSNDGAAWSLIADSAVSPLAWTVPPVLTTSGRIRVTSRTDSTVRAMSLSPFTLYLDGPLVQLRQGWNLLALPVRPSDRSAATLFPGSGRPFAYVTSYVGVDSLYEGTGYWLKHGRDTVIPFSGTPITAETVSVRQGWNLIGGPSSSIACAAIASDPPGLVSSPFYTYDGGYAAAESLAPGFGAWVKCSGAGSLILVPGAAMRADARRPMTHALGAITIADAGGRRQALRLGRPGEPSPPGAFEAPPLPPAGAFDARFADGTLAAYPAGEGIPIALTGARYPLRITWDLGALPAGLVLRTAEGTIPLDGSGSAVVARGPVAVASEAIVPAAFALHQNYPNPFNPSTQVRFDLPRDVHVRLSVHNLLGQEVARLADGAMAAGSHTVRWDAAGFPSGVYLIRISAGSHAATTKSLLLR